VAGTIITDRIESDASYASSITVASPMVVSNTFAIPSGSASAPAISPTGDTNTGIFFPAADTIAFSEGGAEAMRIDSSGNVGIKNTIPSSFDSFANQLVVGSGSGAQGITVYSGTTGAGSLSFADGTSGDASYRGYVYYNHSNDSMALYTAGANQRLIIDSSGRVTMPGQPSLAVSNLDHTTGDYIGGTVYFDTTSSYNSGNGRFTAPVTGKYIVGITVYAFETGMCEVGIYKNGSVWAWLFQKNYTGGNYEGFNGSQIVSLTAGDYINWYNNKGRTRASDDDHRWVAFLG
jgi:hypothetical protein